MKNYYQWGGVQSLRFSFRKYWLRGGEGPGGGGRTDEAISN